MLNIELKRGFKRKSFIFALLACTVICILDYLIVNQYNIIFSYENYPHFLSNYMKVGGRSCYDNFIFFRLSPFSQILTITMPILVAISYSDSYLEDLNSGFLKSILTRCSKAKYLRSKYIANFILSGITFSFPLIIRLIMLITTQGSILPDKTNCTALINGSLWINLYLSHPLLYILLWIFIYFIFSGVISSIALSFSILIRNKFVVLVAPFITLSVIEIIFSLIRLGDFSPSRFLFHYPNVNPVSVIITFIVMLGVTFLTFYIGGKSNEIF